MVHVLCLKAKYFALVFQSIFCDYPTTIVEIYIIYIGLTEFCLYNEC